ncbi:MAG TPA: hypothetical protein VKT82_09285 [Ktedonobacterales bacterium]|nr:hypothetical protein [Ktedonobacterales bacterium]
MTNFHESASSADDFEVEVSALDERDSETDPAFAARSSSGPCHPTTTRTRRLIIGCGALLAALLVLASVPSVRSQALSLFDGGPSPTPGGGYFSYAPLASSQPLPGPGWTLAGPHYASWIAFAPSAPGTGYTCGPQIRSEGQPVPLIIGVTADAGASWQTLVGPTSAVTCNLSIDPTNARDVALLASPCQPCSSPQAAQLYRSFDGGAHWSRWALPPLGTTQSQDLLYAQWVWVGSTLFIAPHQSGGVGYQRLAASVAGQAFAWVDTTGLFAGAPANANINELLATSTTLYIQLDFADCATTCTLFMQSHNDGASWQPFNPKYQGQPVDLIATGGDGRTLLGQVVRAAPPGSRIYLRSTDGGATWQKLASRNDLLIADSIYTAPDGSLYAVFLQDPYIVPGVQGSQAAQGVYALASGGSAWRYVVQAPQAGSLVMAWDTAGHPVALWGLINPNDPSAGLERYQL